ncbi:hypothetical protein DFH07DRAFT_914014 [Mycena maculata]|uniref:Uncharacterized protein n=1 Tax=Mycena maculata TaxID=230809 RepID=A0AAD7NQU0_9AGAR|nr:hypothetical protein DFH07DRAFT_914014 [Mycena maculata]
MPPTTHALPHAHRLRLMRSTRKLGALLGETPLVVETSPTPASFTPALSRSASMMSTDSKRSGRLFTAGHASALGLSAAPPGHGESSSVTRPMLFLRLPGGSGSTTPAERTPLPSPLSPTFSLALNSPSTPPADVSRRRKMAKLARTLGENVPPELVFPTSQTSKGRRRASTLCVPASTHELRRRGADLAREDSVGSLHPAYAGEPEKGWSGEWGGSVGNMEDVVSRLRGLKVK